MTTRVSGSAVCRPKESEESQFYERASTKIFQIRNWMFYCPEKSPEELTAWYVQIKDLQSKQAKFPYRPIDPRREELSSHLGILRVYLEERLFPQGKIDPVASLFSSFRKGVMEPTPLTHNRVVCTKESPWLDQEGPDPIEEARILTVQLPESAPPEEQDFVKQFQLVRARLAHLETLEKQLQWYKMEYAALEKEIATRTLVSRGIKRLPLSGPIELFDTGRRNATGKIGVPKKDPEIEALQRQLQECAEKLKRITQSLGPISLYQDRVECLDKMIKEIACQLLDEEYTRITSLSPEARECRFQEAQRWGAARGLEAVVQKRFQEMLPETFDHQSLNAPITKWAIVRREEEILITITVLWDIPGSRETKEGVCTFTLQPLMKKLVPLDIQWSLKSCAHPNK